MAGQLPMAAAMARSISSILKGLRVISLPVSLTKLWVSALVVKAKTTFAIALAGVR